MEEIIMEELMVAAVKILNIKEVDAMTYCIATFHASRSFAELVHREPSNQNNGQVFRPSNQLVRL